MGTCPWNPWNSDMLMVRITRPNFEWLRLSRVYTFDLPTEKLVTKTEIVTPLQGRYYEIDLYVKGKSLLKYRELTKRDDFDGLAKETQVYLYEIWHDTGMDGHRDYNLYCWTLHPGIYQGEPHRMLDELSP